MRLFIFLVMCIQSAVVFSQELIEREFEKGYAKNGQKYSVWEYYNEKKELELKINHSTGRVFFLKPDTTSFIIFKDGEWRAQRLTIYPIPVVGYHNFLSLLEQHIGYPSLARRMDVEGEVMILFEVDTLGNITNLKIAKDVGSGCGQAVLKALQENKVPWIPALFDGKRIPSSFVVRVIFALDRKNPTRRQINLFLARELRPIQIVVKQDEAAYELDSLNAINDVTQFTTGQRIYYSLDKALGSNERVTNLSLSGQNLGILSSRIAELNGLEVLDLEQNNLSELPVELQQLIHLQELYAPDNHLTGLPVGVGSLTTMKILGLSSNAFTEFPKPICNLQKLEMLDLGNNQIQEIPVCIGQLKKLKIIILINNRITALPNEFYDLKHLDKIYLKGNPLPQDEIQKIKATFKKAELILE